MKTLGTRLNYCVYDKRYQQKLLTRYLKHHVNHCTFNVLTVDVYSSLYKIPDDLLKLHNIGFFLHDISPFHEIPHNSQQGRSTHNILIIEIAATPREQTNLFGNIATMECCIIGKRHFFYVNEGSASCSNRHSSAVMSNVSLLSMTVR